MLTFDRCVPCMPAAPGPAPIISAVIALPPPIIIADDAPPMPFCIMGPRACAGMLCQQKSRIPATEYFHAHERADANNNNISGPCPPAAIPESHSQAIKHTHTHVNRQTQRHGAWSANRVIKRVVNAKGNRGQRDTPRATSSL